MSESEETLDMEEIQDIDAPDIPTVNRGKDARGEDALHEDIKGKHSLGPTPFRLIHFFWGERVGRIVKTEL